MAEAATPEDNHLTVIDLSINNKYCLQNRSYLSYINNTMARLPIYPRLLNGLFAALEFAIILWAAAIVVNVLRGPGAWPIPDVGLRLDPSSYRVASPTIRPSHLNFGDVFATVWVSGDDAQSLRGAVTGPLCGLIVIRALVLLTLCELFRRLFRGIARRELFRTGGPRQICAAGIAVLALSLAGAVFDGVCGQRIVTFLQNNVAFEGAIGVQIRLPPPAGFWVGPYTFHGFFFRLDSTGAFLGPLRFGLIHLDLRTLLIGLILIGLGEAMRQGLALQEENDLTV